MELTLKPYARLAAYGAFGVAAGATGLFALLAYVARATPASGIDQTQAVLSWISLAVPFACIVAVHIMAARTLLRFAAEP